MLTIALYSIIHLVNNIDLIMISFDSKKIYVYNMKLAFYFFFLTPLLYSTLHLKKMA